MAESFKTNHFTRKAFNRMKCHKNETYMSNIIQFRLVLSILQLSGGLLGPPRNFEMEIIKPTQKNLTARIPGLKIHPNEAKVVANGTAGN